jgi:hypothetical protein
VGHDDTPWIHCPFVAGVVVVAVAAAAALVGEGQEEKYRVHWQFLVLP